MGKKFIIRIEVDPDAQEIVITDEAGKEHRVKSVTMFGGDTGSGTVYLFGWGASADAAWAYKEGFLYAEESGDASYRSFSSSAPATSPRRSTPRPSVGRSRPGNYSSGGRARTGARGSGISRSVF